MREAIVLAGGLGTRLRDAVPDLPKAMAPVAGRPFLALVLDVLVRAGFARATLALGYRADTIVAHFGAAYGPLELVHEIEPQPLGTGGAIRAALVHVRGDHTHVLNGDTWLEPDVAGLEMLWETWRQTILVAREVPDAARYGRLQLDADARVIAFGEKTQAGPGLVNAGWYVLGRHALDAFPSGTAFSLEADYLPRAVANGTLRASVTEAGFIDIGVPADYRRAQRELGAPGGAD